MLGVSDEQKEQALQQDGGVPATAVTVKITAVHRGDVEDGDQVVIVQTDGSPDELPLQGGKGYLLFAEPGVDGTFVVLGGSAGMYIADGDTYRAVVPDAAPFESLTSAEAASLVQ